ncbi:MAG: RNA polymerase sigma factor [Rhodospirillaceae bacterium]|nr:RNA polymerase sigma factor [Rhodospirillaceae bacterium]
MGESLDPTRHLWDRMVTLRPRVYRFAYVLVRSPDEADDLTQAALERAMTRHEQWQEGTRLDSWLFKIVHNLWLNRLSAENVRRQHRPALSLVPTEEDGVRNAESRLTLALVRRLIDKLPQDQRMALLLIVVEGLSYREAADVLEVSVGTVTSRLARARIALRAALDDEAPRTAAGTLAGGGL